MCWGGGGCLGSFRVCVSKIREMLASSNAEGKKSQESLGGGALGQEVYCERD